MRPILIEWRGVRIHSYPVLVYLGMNLGIVGGNYAAHLAALDPMRVFVATVLLLVPALVGARVLFIAVHRRDMRLAGARLWDRSEGGSAMLGGLPLAVPASVPLLRVLELPLGAFWDVATFTIAIGLVCGRLGCLLHGCCGGRPTEGFLGMTLPDRRGVWRRRYPTQLLEAGWVVVLLAVAAGVWQMELKAGVIFVVAVTGYAIGRSALQFLRAG